MALRWTVPVPLETRSRMDIELPSQDVREKCLNIVFFWWDSNFEFPLPERIYEGKYIPRCLSLFLESYAKR